MCFSATADFVAAGVVGVVGAATLTQVRTGRDVLFASLPGLFALHQLTEGFVWLGLEGRVDRGVSDVAAFVYVLYAQGLLPLLVPLALLLIEPPGRRRKHIAPFLALGALTAAYLFWVDVAGPLRYSVVERSIAYETGGTLLGVAAVCYVVAVCGAALLSGYPWIVAFGVANLVGLVVTLVLLRQSFTSVWCAYAALTSVLILAFFLRRNRTEGRLVRRYQQQPPVPA